MFTRKGFLSAVTQMRKNRLSILKKSMPITVRSSTILEACVSITGDDVLFLCGYEAGALGFTLYHELTAHTVKCVILAPTSMPVPVGKRESKQISATQP